MFDSDASKRDTHEVTHSVKNLYLNAYQRGFISQEECVILESVLTVGAQPAGVTLTEVAVHALVLTHAVTSARQRRTGINALVKNVLS